MKKKKKGKRDFSCYLLYSCTCYAHICCMCVSFKMCINTSEKNVTNIFESIKLDGLCKERQRERKVGES